MNFLLGSTMLWTYKVPWIRGSLEQCSAQHSLNTTVIVKLNFYFESDQANWILSSAFWLFTYHCWSVSLYLLYTCVSKTLITLFSVVCNYVTLWIWTSSSFYWMVLKWWPVEETERKVAQEKWRASSHKQGWKLNLHCSPHIFQGF